MRTLTDYCFLEVRTTQPIMEYAHLCARLDISRAEQDVDAQQYWYAFDCVAASIDEDDWDSLGQLNYARLAAHATRLVQEPLPPKQLKDDIVSHRLNKAFILRNCFTASAACSSREDVLLTLAGKEKALGPDHTSTLNTVNNLGLLYVTKASWIEAEKMYDGH